MAWQFLVTDLAGTPVGEVSNARERSVSLPHQRIPSASFTIPVWDTLADTLLATDTLLRCYRTDPLYGGAKTLAFHGPVVTAEEAVDGESKTLQVTASGPLWRLSKRIIPASLLSGSAVYGTDVAPVNLGAAAFTMLSDVNATSFTGIEQGTNTATGTGVISLDNITDAATGLAHMHAGLNSFEFVVVPQEPTNVGGTGGWPRIGTLNLAPVLGVTRDDAVFEFGTPRANITSYTRNVARDNLMNQAIISVSGWPNGAGGKVPITRQNGASVAARGLFEDKVDDGGIVDDDLRTSVADFHVLYRKDPRVTTVFRPAVNASPSPLTDYAVGDTVRARATVNGVTRFDNLFRVWGITFTIDVNGNEAVELELVTPS